MNSWLTTLAQPRRFLLTQLQPWLNRDGRFAVLVGAGLLMIFVFDPALFALIVATVSDAYLGVSVFVAMTLAGFYLLDRMFKQRLAGRLSEAGFWQVPLAALLGALPGCGGAIIVVTQFVHGRMRFGSLVAVLIATMGDAAFLLLARDPATAGLVFGLAVLAAIVTGFLVNQLHEQDFMKVEPVARTLQEAPELRVPQGLQTLFWALLIPGAVIGLAAAFRLEETLLRALGVPLAAVEALGLAGGFLCLMVWFSQPLNSWTARFARTCSGRHCPLDAAIAETAFVSVWVMTGFLAYELLIHFSGLDLAVYFAQLGVLVPLLAVVVGLIPGCGPQIVVTTLYLNGVVPLSAQLGNAVSNDGDALFPAIALAPRAALVATVYSALPALALGYGAWVLGY